MAYHRQNGVTKQGLKGGVLMTYSDGMMGLIDIFHQAIFNYYFEDTQIFTFVEYMPVQIRQKEILNRALNLIGATLYPISLALLLPVFMYAIVLEREEKLQEFMRMNGMRMKNY